MTTPMMSFEEWTSMYNMVGTDMPAADMHRDFAEAYNVPVESIRDYSGALVAEVWRSGKLHLWTIIDRSDYLAEVGTKAGDDLLLRLWGDFWISEIADTHADRDTLIDVWEGLGRLMLLDCPFENFDPFVCANDTTEPKEVEFLSKAEEPCRWFRERWQDMEDAEDYGRRCRA